MSSLNLMMLALVLLCSVEGAALACVGLCRLQQLSFKQSKRRWLAVYFVIFLIGTAAAFRPLMQVGIDWYHIEAVILAGLLYAVLRTRKKWKRDDKPAAPPESNRAPLE